MQCSRCHTDVPEGAAFCPHCGQAVPLDPPAQTPEVRVDGSTAGASSAAPDDVRLALLLEARSLYRSPASMEVLETVCPLILLLSFVSDIGRSFGAVYVFLILIILIWSQSLTRRTAEYFEHTGHDTWSRLGWKIRRLCQFQLGAVAGVSLFPFWWL